MSELAGVFKGLFDKIGGFFHIFDASYFIAGFVGLFTISVTYLLNISTPTVPGVLSEMAENYKISTVIIVCLLIYSLGFILFNIGRVVRMVMIEKMPIHDGTNQFCRVVDFQILNAIKNYGLKDDFIIRGKQEFNEMLISKYSYRPTDFYGLWSTECKEDVHFKYYVTENRILYKYYTSIWSKMRRNDNSVNNLGHLDRKWVTNAKYDGFIGLWSILIICLLGCCANQCICQSMIKAKCLVPLISCIILLCIFTNEALKNYKYLIQDLLSSYALSIERVNSPEEKSTAETIPESAVKIKKCKKGKKKRKN